ncbi:MAG: hypothetical protein IK038_14320 [Bacteroidaceae bacterium]|nr:hypothetical protein [Bacteroidaceae bacterium]MBR4794781.1 hypothetical protein [Bacteroidaceae bacterium]
MMLNLKSRTRIRANKCLAMVLALLLTLCFCAKSTAANGYMSTGADGSMDSVNDTIQSCLQAAGFELDENYLISEAYLIQNSAVENNYLYFVFYNDGRYKCIGEFVTSQGTRASSFFQEKCDVVTALFNSETPFYVSRFGNESWGIISAEEAICLYGKENISDAGIVFNGSVAKRIELNEITINSANGREGGMRPLIDESKYLNTPVRANASVNGVGLCWLASALSMIDYKIGTTGYTTLTLYYYLSSLYSAIYGNPVGTTEYIVRTFNTFSINVATAQSGLTFDSVKYYIDIYKPIMSVIMTADLSVSHAVVINGYHKFSTSGLYIYYSYRIMDPNCSNYVTVSASGSGTHYTYNAGGLVYTLWTSRYH